MPWICGKRGATFKFSEERSINSEAVKKMCYYGNHRVFADNLLHCHKEDINHSMEFWLIHLCPTNRHHHCHNPSSWITLDTSNNLCWHSGTDFHKFDANSFREYNLSPINNTHTLYVRNSVRHMLYDWINLDKSLYRNSKVCSLYAMMRDVSSQEYKPAELIFNIWWISRLFSVNYSD